MNNNIDYDFLNTEFNSFEKGKNLKILYFSEGSKRFLLKTHTMESFEDYVLVTKNETQACIPDSTFSDFDLQKINQDTLQNISVFSDSVLIINYNNLGDSIFQVSAEKIINYSDEDIVELKKNVVLKNNKNNILKTNRLFWNIEKKKFLSLDSVIIQTSDKSIHGCGLYSDDNFENYQIYNIRGEIQIDTD
tara:strand:+ start:76 stop:648 length:573 start_codon:yes stop_codon:yes gene_type:complete